MSKSNLLHNATNVRDLNIALSFTELKFRTAEFVLKSMQHISINAQIAEAIKCVIMCK